MQVCEFVSIANLHYHGYAQDYEYNAKCKLDGLCIWVAQQQANEHAETNPLDDEHKDNMQSDVCED